MNHEQTIEIKILQELLALQVPREMLGRQVKDRSGRIDIVIYTQPRCLIEVKAILNERELKKAIDQLNRYGASFPKGRLFIAWGLLRADRWTAMTLMRRKGVRQWTSAVAKAIAEEAKATPLEVAAVPVRRSPISNSKGGMEMERDLEEFLTTASAMSYRTLARLRAVERAIRVLPAPEQEEARVALERLGKRKAAILVPAFKRRPGSWREIVEEAEYCSERDLQRQVTQLYGLKSRGLNKRGKDENLYRTLLDGLPLDRRGEVHVVFEAASRLERSDDFFDAFLRIVEEAKGNILRKADAGDHVLH